MNIKNWIKNKIHRRWVAWLSQNQGELAKQGLYEELHSLAVRGMNFGGGASFQDSGELYVISYVKERYPEGTQLVIFDVGSNTGGYSVKLSEVFMPPCVIHAFEPSKRTFELFKKTTQGIPNLIANNLGASDTNSTKPLFVSEANSGLASVYQRDLRFVGLEMKEEGVVSFIVLDDYCSKNDIQKIHFLKMDIEGHELNALKGVANLIKNDAIDFIQFEFGGCNIDSRTFFKDFYYLLNEKYKIYRIVRDGLFEVKNYKETYEIFTTINFLAERRALSNSSSLTI